MGEVMSWDLVVMKCREPPPPVADLPKDFASDVMGSVAAIRAAIDSAIPNVDWSDPTWGTHNAGDYSLEFAIDGVESANTFSVYVRGSGDPITALLRLGRQNGWYLLDLQIPEWLHHCSDQSTSWSQFQSWRDRVLDHDDEE
jgi:hypothetical protein